MTRLARLALAAAVIGVTGLTASVLAFVRPATGKPDRADAVVVLSGDHGERLTRAMKLLTDGVTSTLVLDGTPDSGHAVELCRGGQPFEVVCLRPEPDNTREEARAAARLVESRGWERVVVATTTYHVPRSALLFRRCTDAEVTMVDGDPPFRGLRLVRAVAREWAATAYVLTVARGC